MRLLARFALPLAATITLAVTTDALAQNNTPRFRDDLQVSGPALRGSPSDLVVTFKAPFALPGVTLPAGTYVFQRPAAGVVRVLSADRRHVYLTRHTTATQRPDSGELAAIWAENIEGAPLRLKAWFAPGRTDGQELSYPAAGRPRQLAAR